MRKDPDHNSTDSAEIQALINRLGRGQLRDEDAQSLARLLLIKPLCRRRASARLLANNL
jgi:hypothetical protein